MTKISPRIQTASCDHAADILALQKLAYLDEARLYDDFTIAPLIDTLENTQLAIEEQTVLIAVADAGIIGSVRAYQKENTCLVGRLIVHPDHRRRGLGSRLLSEIEAHFPNADRFELFAGHKSENNIRLYEKHEYHIFKTEKVNDRLNFVFMEKFRIGY
jgi:ribosomal protein S18 acetylase RimI-like enzyme